jgi:replicative DNA helicase
MRLLCAEAGIPMSKVRSGKLGPSDWTQFVDAAAHLHDAPMFIVDAGNVTILDIRAKARRLKSKEGLALIVVDYLQLMSHHRRVENRQQEIAEISRSLKLLAKELDVPILALSQLNRDPERGNSRPQLANLRESGALEQDADVVMFIHRERGPDGHWASDTAELMIAKHRNGPTGTAELHFKEDLMQFRSLYRA